VQNFEAIPSEGSDSSRVAEIKEGTTYFLFADSR
jgi:hypothetical protein